VSLDTANEVLPNAAPMYALYRLPLPAACFPSTVAAVVPLVVLLAVVVVVAVVGDEFIVCDVDCECSECDAEAGERALEAVAGAEGTRVSPGLAVFASVSCYDWSCS